MIFQLDCYDLECSLRIDNIDVALGCSVLLLPGYLPPPEQLRGRSFNFIWDGQLLGYSHCDGLHLSWYILFPSHPIMLLISPFSYDSSSVHRQVLESCVLSSGQGHCSRVVGRGGP